MDQRKHADHRWSTRQPITFPVKLFRGGEPIGQGRAHNVGIGGMFVELGSHRIPADAPLSVAFTVDVNGMTTHHRLPATVIWEGDRGAGLMFTDFNVDTVHALREILYPASAAS
ncbi:hypothetical protein SVA_2298 [Sulfurifustis variabilis]|uniref:PilZ domain-containing protein n=1 Tax=Sulfurifustis variabilis TaxID=1675686 RepID=A0A1B4V5Q7_9GAMM|nr:PilZ domain-containing protein [Sulfurifustis variabilis]BAU48848.1 hypothetical protein SVA_2298 [Sulfurifustis variabilis]